MCAALIVLNYTENKVFMFAASDTGAFLFWQFIPMTVAVIPGLLWEGIYNEVCRLQSYRDLASARGSDTERQPESDLYDFVLLVRAVPRTETSE
jgi:hypothetical protein